MKSELTPEQLAALNTIREELARADRHIALAMEVLRGCDEIASTCGVPLPFSTFHVAELVGLFSAVQLKRDALEHHHRYSLFPSARRAALAAHVKRDTEAIGVLG